MEPNRSQFWDAAGPHDAGYDPEYLINRDSVQRDDRRRLVNELWASYEPYCGDPDFLNRVRREFTPLTWQMYVAGCFLDAGFVLEASGSKGPDIKTSINGRRLWVECIAVGPGEGENAAVRTYGSVSRKGSYRPPPDEKIELRITAGIWEKTKQRRDWLTDGTVDGADLYVIALCTAAIPDADLETSCPMS